MRNLQRSLLPLLALALTAPLLPGQEPPSAGADSSAIRGVIARYMQARNDKDAEAVGRLFTPDADQLVSTGEWRRGLNSLIRGTAASSQKESGKSSIAVESVRFIAPDVAIADGRYQTTSLNGAVRNMWTTLILKRENSAWRITAIRNMLPASPAPSH